MIETILTATAVSAIISGLYSLIKSCVDNRAKRNDAITLFKYTKLYEIISQLQLQPPISEKNLGTGKTKICFDRLKALQTSYALAKPLLNPKHYDSFDKGFREMRELEISVIGNTEKLPCLIEKHEELEKQFIATAQVELTQMLKK